MRGLSRQTAAGLFAAMVMMGGCAPRTYAPPTDAQGKRCIRQVNAEMTRCIHRSKDSLEGADCQRLYDLAFQACGGEVEP